MTLDGTNTWVLSAPGSRDVVVVDPGPADDAHLEAVAAHGDVALVLLTHGHLDHSEGAPPFHEATGAPVAAFDPARCVGPLTDGLDLRVGGLTVRVLATPGHSGDSVTFVADDGASAAVLTGDTVLGRGPSVVAHPDGRLDDYLATLRRLRDLRRRCRLAAWCCPATGRCVPTSRPRPPSTSTTGPSAWTRCARRWPPEPRPSTTCSTSSTRTLGRSCGAQRR